jgi:hypothetical protein
VPFVIGDGKNGIDIYDCELLLPARNHEVYYNGFGFPRPKLNNGILPTNYY